jgi:hypothetical protein
MNAIAGLWLDDQGSKCETRNESNRHRMDRACCTLPADQRLAQAADERKDLTFSVGRITFLRVDRMVQRETVA